MARLTLVTLSTSYRYQSSSMLEHYATTVSAIRVYLFLFQTWRNSNRQLIGMFSAASNVTGLLVDVDDVTSILHEYGARSRFLGLRHCRSLRQNRHEPNV